VARGPAIAAGACGTHSEALPGPIARRDRRARPVDN
jgi:hypothetical protein